MMGIDRTWLELVMILLDPSVVLEESSNVATEVHNHAEQPCPQAAGYSILYPQEPTSCVDPCNHTLQPEAKAQWGSWMAFQVVIGMLIAMNKTNP
jgi:hypothetical protein